MFIVPAEIINQREDWVQADRLAEYREPLFSPEEQCRSRMFHGVWESVAADEINNPSPPLSELIGTESWGRVRVAAEGAPKVFGGPGGFSEEQEAFPP